MNAEDRVWFGGAKVEGFITCDAIHPVSVNLGTASYERMRARA